MNVLLALLNHGLAPRVGWVLLHSLWQGALVGAVFGLVRYGLRGHSPSARYLAGCLALVAMAAAPAASLLMGWVPTPQAGTESFPLALASAPAGRVFHSLDGGYSSVGDGVFSLFGWSAGFFGRLAPALAVGWLLGVVLFSWRLTRNCWWVRRIRTRDNAPVEVCWAETLKDLRCRLGISRPVRLLKSALVEVPAVIGWWRPIILLPAASLAGLTPGQMEAILAHELAHVRRWDYVVNAAQCLLETLMFYHPVVWWISRCVREERENCCDDLVVKVCGDRLAYARALATLEESRAELPNLAFAASGSSLLKRIRRLLGATEARPVNGRQLGGLALLGLGLLMIILGVYLLTCPSAYEARALIKAERDPSGSFDPLFIQTEFTVIQSEVVLDKVIEELGLKQAWGKEYGKGEPLKTPETVALLKQRMALRPVRNTTLIEIRVSSDKPEEATRIANAIARAYEAHRKELRAEWTQGGLNALKIRFEGLETQVRDAQRQVEVLRKELKIFDAMGNGDAPTPLITSETLRHYETLRIESQTDLVRQEWFLNELLELQRTNYSALIQTLPTAAQDSLLGSFLEQLDVAQQRLRTVTKDFGPEYAESKQAASSVEDLSMKITNRVEGIMLALDARVKSTRTSLDQLEKLIKEATRADSDEADRSQPYWEAKRKLEALQRFRQILELKMAQENIDSALPTRMIVEIVDNAVPPRRPSSPNRPRAAALIAFGLLLDIIGLLLVRSNGRPTQVCTGSGAAQSTAAASKA